MLVGLQVEDDALYQSYREAMLPILEAHGGGFRYDLRVSEVLRSATPEPMNRLFAIYFASEQAMQDCFADPDYVRAKERFFGPSVTATTIIASYTR